MFGTGKTRGPQSDKPQQMLKGKDKNLVSFIRIQTKSSEFMNVVVHPSSGTRDFQGERMLLLCCRLSDSVPLGMLKQHNLMARKGASHPSCFEMSTI